MLLKLTEKELKDISENMPRWLRLLGGCVADGDPNSDGSIVEIAPGMYNGYFNLHNCLEAMVRGEIDKSLWNSSWVSLHGVADTSDQIRGHFRDQIEDTEATYIIGATPVIRDVSNKGKGGGWRWHKWGTYIGTHTPTTEYLDDEPDIESVIVFSLYRFKQVDANGRPFWRF